MELEFRFRNNDMGMLFPTFQERVNTMLPAQKTEAETEASAARELPAPVTDTPHMLNNEEMTQALAQGLAVLAGDGVGGTTGRVGHHQCDDLLRKGGLGQEGQRHQGRAETGQALGEAAGKGGQHQQRDVRQLIFFSSPQ